MRFHTNSVENTFVLRFNFLSVRICKIELQIKTLYVNIKIFILRRLWYLVIVSYFARIDCKRFFQKYAYEYLMYPGVLLKYCGVIKRISFFGQ